jgi:hypothetical protein
VTAVRLSAGLLERVAAGAAGIAAPDRPASEVREHQARGARRVLEYRFGGDLRPRRARLDELAAERGARAFLDAYSTHAPAVSGAALVYRSSASCLATLLRGLELDRPKWESRFTYHRGAFDAVPGRVAALGLEAPP